MAQLEELTKSMHDYDHDIFADSGLFKIYRIICHYQIPHVLAKVICIH